MLACGYAEYHSTLHQTTPPAGTNTLRATVLRVSLATAGNCATFAAPTGYYPAIMFITVLKSKLHRVKVTQAELNYVGSITIDEDLMDAAGLLENEQVHIVNNNNGERLITYVIKGERGTGIICLNGAAARRAQVGDIVIIISYAMMTTDEAKTHTPTVVFPDANNRLVKG